MSPYRSLCIFMDYNGSLWVLSGAYASLMVLMRPNKSLCIFIDFNGSLWVLIIPIAFSWIPVGPYGFL